MFSTSYYIVQDFLLILVISRIIKIYDFYDYYQNPLPTSQAPETTPISANVASAPGPSVTFSSTSTPPKTKKTLLKSQSPISK